MSPKTRTPLTDKIAFALLIIALFPFALVFYFGVLAHGAVAARAHRRQYRQKG